MKRILLLAPMLVMAAGCAAVEQYNPVNLVATGLDAGFKKATEKLRDLKSNESAEPKKSIEERLLEKKRQRELDELPTIALSDKVKVRVKDGYVLADNLTFDSRTRLAVGGPTFYTIKSGSMKSLFGSFASRVSDWQRYVETHDCSLEAALATDSGIQIRSNLLSTSCTALGIEAAEQVNKIADQVTPRPAMTLRKAMKEKPEDLYGHLTQDIGVQLVDTKSARGRAINEYAGLPSVDPTRPDTAIAALGKLRTDPAIVETIQAIIALIPPEKELIPLVEKEKSEPVEWRRQNVGGLAMQSVPTKWRKYTYSEPALQRNKLFNDDAVRNWLGWEAFLDDTLILQLKHFDFPLSAPRFGADYLTGEGMTTIVRKGGHVSLETIPRAMMAFLIPPFMNIAPENQIQGPGGERYIGFPEITPSRERYQTAWATWHKLVQGMTPDEIRKLVIFSKLQRGESPAGSGNSMGFLVRNAVAPAYMSAVNNPLLWKIDEVSGENTSLSYTVNQANPGYTLSVFLEQALVQQVKRTDGYNDETGAWHKPKEIVSEVKHLPVFGEFIQALFAGNADYCKALVNKAVSSSALESVKARAREEVSAIQLPREKLVPVLGENPAAIYRHLAKVMGVQDLRAEEEEAKAAAEQKRAQEQEQQRTMRKVAW